MHVGDDDLGAVVVQVLHEVVPDLADTGDTDPPPAQGGVAPRHLRRGAHALEDAVRREHAGVAGAAVLKRAPGDVVALPGDDVHVLAEGAHVAGGQVAPVQRLHEPAVGPQQRLGLVCAWVADDDGLPAAEVKARQRGLVGHALRQVQHVTDGLGLVRVGVVTGAAKAGPQRCGIDRDDRSQPAGAVLAEHHLLVVLASAKYGEVRGLGHGGDSSLGRVPAQWRGWLLPRYVAIGDGTSRSPRGRLL